MGRRTVLLIAAIVVAALGAALVWMYADRADERAQADAAPVEVLVATVDIGAGTSGAAISEAASAELRTLPAASVPPGALSDLTPVTDLVTLGPVFAGPGAAPADLRHPAAVRRRPHPARGHDGHRHLSSATPSASRDSSSPARRSPSSPPPTGVGGVRRAADHDPPAQGAGRRCRPDRRCPARRGLDQHGGDPHRHHDPRPDPGGGPEGDPGLPDDRSSTWACSTTSPRSIPRSPAPPPRTCSTDDKDSHPLMTALLEPDVLARDSIRDAIGDTTDTVGSFDELAVLMRNQPELDTGHPRAERRQRARAGLRRSCCAPRTPPWA